MTGSPTRGLECIYFHMVGSADVVSCFVNFLPQRLHHIFEMSVAVTFLQVPTEIVERLVADKFPLAVNYPHAAPRLPASLLRLYPRWLGLSAGHLYRKQLHAEAKN